MSTAAALPPGFRFHPTDEELILHYLRNRAASAPCPVPIIADVDIYKFDPWDLPCQAVYGEHEWYFFSPRDRKYPNGIRPNRAAGSGYWKATGTDKPIHDPASMGGEPVGVKKALVFYKGRPPKGSKTSWIMHEYRLSAADPLSSSVNTNPGAANAYKPVKFCNVSMRLDDWVLCRIYKKSGLQASPMVPPLADYDHMDLHAHSSGNNNNDDDGLSSFSFSGSGGGFVVDAHDAACSSFLYAAPPPSSRTAMAPRLPAIPSMSELLDDYALAQLFDAAAPDEHLAVHPSLNQLLSVGDAEYYSSSSPSPAGKRKQAAAEDQRAPAAKRMPGFAVDDAAPQSSAAESGLQAAVLGAGLSSHQMLPQF